MNKKDPRDFIDAQGNVIAEFVRYADGEDTHAQPPRLPTVWSFGGGTQSAAIAALIILGRLPKPDYAVMVDTEREKPATWMYLKYVVRPNLEAVGVDIVVVPKSRYATVDVWGGKTGRTMLLPVFTTQKGGSVSHDDEGNVVAVRHGAIGKLTNWCSGEWKREVMFRYLRREIGLTKWESWLGISTDEMARMRLRDKRGNPHWFPLIEGVPMRRSDCYSLITNTMGWPSPPRSACSECPNQNNNEWRETRDFFPEEWERVCQFDEEIRKTDPHVFLHQSGKPLREVDLDAQLDLFGGQEGCDSGYCMV